jgi:hypothetical protein
LDHGLADLVLRREPLVGLLGKGTIAGTFSLLGTTLLQFPDLLQVSHHLRDEAGTLTLRNVPTVAVRSDAARADAKEAREKRIFDLWLACWTQQEIANAVGVPKKTVDDQIASLGDSVLQNQSAQSLANHATDFEPPRGRAHRRRSWESRPGNGTRPPLQ